MSEENIKNFRIPVKGEAGKHTEHKVRTINVSSKEGIKSLYCIDCKKIITYMFAKNKNWNIDKCKIWVEAHEGSKKTFTENHVDQVEDFLSITVAYETGETKVFTPNSESFIMNEEIEEFTMGQGVWDEVDKARGDGLGQGGEVQGDGGASKCVCSSCGIVYSKIKGEPCSKSTCPACGGTLVGKSIGKEIYSVVMTFDTNTKVSEEIMKQIKKNFEQAEAKSYESIDIIKMDKVKQIVYGAYLVPETPDWDGDVVSEEDIEKVAHDFLVEYRTIDEMHKDIIKADIVESMIAWDDIDFRGKMVTKGTWIGAIHVHDKDVWKKIESGEYRAFSVQIAGIREPITAEEV